MMMISRPSGRMRERRSKKPFSSTTVTIAISARTHHDSDIVVAAPLDAHILRAIAETIDLTVTNDGLAALANDGAIGFANNRAFAFAGLMAFCAQLVHPPQRLSLRR